MRHLISVGLMVVAALTASRCSNEPSRFTEPPPDVLVPRDSTRPPDVAPSDDIGARDITPVQTRRDLFIGGAPTDAPDRFGGSEDPSRAPSFVYPEDGTIVPPNLPSFEVHFRPGRGNDLFEVSFVGRVSTLRIYTGCAEVEGGCVLSLDTMTFTAVAEVARAGGTAQIELRGTSSSAGGSFGRAAPRTLGMAQTALRGGIYYWHAASGSVLRYDFGRADARPEVYLTGGINPLNCVGCHVLSRDGSRIAIGRGVPGPAQAEIFDVATRTRVAGGFGMNFGTFSPDARLFLHSDGLHLAMHDLTTGMPAPGLPDGIAGTMPDWSPDGTRVIFAHSTLPRPPPPLDTLATINQAAPADLMVMGYSGGAFAAPGTLLRSSGENNFYPNFSPDNQWVVFNRGRESSEDVLDARLWVIRADGRGGPVELARANGPGDHTNSWPKWAPFVETYAEELSEPLLWVTFSSKRDYGLRLHQNDCMTAMVDGCHAQIWMAAFRPGHGGDPSAPAFWLPFQSLDAGYHIAQWTREVLRRDCTASNDCATGEYCSRGACVGAPP